MAMQSTMRRWHPSGGERLTLALAILTLLVPSVLFSGSVKEHENILELLRSSSLVVQGQVEDVVPPGPDRICTAQIRIEKLLKGDVRQKKLRVAQELLFPSDQPSYRKGKHVLLFLVDLPEYSRWNDVRSKGIAYMAAGGGEGVKEMDPKAVQETSDFLEGQQKLAAYRTEDEKRKYLTFLLEGLGSPVDLVQEASVAALLRLDNLDMLLGKDEDELLERFIRDKSKSRRARVRLIRALSTRQGFEETIAQVLQEEPEMRLSVLGALDSVGTTNKVGVRALETCLKDSDPEVRLEALRFVSREPPPAVNALVGAMAVGDASQEVRARAMTEVSRRGGQEGREILCQGLRDESPLVVYNAADGIRKLGGENAARDLGELLQAEDPRHRFIGILMLGTMEEEEARDILKDASEHHTDMQTREWSRRVLDQGPVDPRSMRQVLGVE
jgi:HEAT repeat protein